MSESEVLRAAGIDAKLSLAFLDVNDVRERLERVPLVKSASVRKLYPNELVDHAQPSASRTRSGSTTASSSSSPPTAPSST